MTVIRYTRGAELEDIDLTWRDSAGVIRDFSAGWTFTARIGTPDTAAIIQKTTGITGAATAPNLTISFAAAELDTVPVGSYHLDLIARFTGTSQDLTRSWLFQILPGVLATA